MQWAKRHVAPQFDCVVLRSEWCNWQWHLASGDTGVNGIAWLKKSCCTSFWLSLPWKCIGSIHDAISIMWCWHWHQWHLMTKKVILLLLWSENAMVPLIMLLELCPLPKENNDAIYDPVGIMWHWKWSQWHNVTPTLMASHYANASGNCVIRPKNHITSNFDCLNLSKIMVTMRVVTASCDANTSSNGMTWPEK